MEFIKGEFIVHIRVNCQVYDHFNRLKNGQFTKYFSLNEEQLHGMVQKNINFDEMQRDPQQRANSDKGGYNHQNLQLNVL